MEIRLQFPLGVVSGGHYEPQGGAYLWDASLVWLNAVSDAAIALAYYCIPFFLLWYVRRKKDLGFREIYVGFAVFIFACGTIHLLEVWNIWHADYWLEGFVKTVTAVISAIAAYRLYKLLPAAIQVPSPIALQQINRSLIAEVESGKTTQARMNDLTEQLERRVAERTAALQSANEELQRRIAESNRAKEALQDSEELFFKAFRHSPDCLVIVRLSDRTVVRANDAVARLWGTTPEQLIGKPTREYTSWVDENDRVAFMETLREKGQCLNHETDLRMTDGRVGKFNVSTRMLTIRGEPCALSVMSDITERKKAEGAISLLAAIVESSDDAIIGRDLNGLVTSWNAGAEKVLGYTAVEMLGQSIDRLIPVERKGEDVKTLERIRRGEGVRSLETIRLSKAGKQIEVSVTVSPIKDAGGRTVGVSKILRDISEERRAAEARRESEARYRTLFDYAPDGIVIATPDGYYLDANASICRMLGYPLDELVGLHSSAIVAESEIQYIEPAIKAIHAEVDYHREWMFKKKDGTLFSAEVIATMMPDGNLLALIRDVTERKNAARALREKDRLLHSADRRLAEIMHGMTEACFALDERWRFTFVNDRGETLLRQRRDQMLGRPVWEVFPKMAGTPIEKNFRRALEERTPVSFEVLSPQTDRWLDIRLFPTAEGLAAFFLDIHERKLGEEALRESEARYRGTLDRMMEGCQIIGRDWRYLYLNDVAAWHGRRAPQELLGKTIQESYPGIEGTTIFASIRRCMENQHSEQIESDFVYPDGSTASFQLGIQSVPEGVFILSLDVTERKQAEVALRRSREEFKDLFDNAPVGYHEVDSHGRFVRVNQAELRMLGYSAIELDGRYVWEIAADPEQSRRAVEEKLAGRPPPSAFERILKRKDGSTFPVLVEDRLVKGEDGTISGIRAIIQDVTERKLAEEKIQKLNSDLEHRVIERTAQLEAANKELEAFSYSVSHDLRTPLRAVDGFSQAVLEDFGPQLPPQGRHQLKTIRESAQRMGELIDDLLAFSRLSRQTLRKQPVDMNRLVTTVLEDLKDERSQRQIEIKMGSLPSSEGDSSLLKQAWINLISNALKYSRRRENALVEIGSTPTPEGTVYFVRDNGTGFDMRYAHKLFGVFQRLHRAEEYEGTGVGLAIVQRVVHRHGGRIWAEAAVNQGATFYFTLNGGIPHE